MKFIKNTIYITLFLILFSLNQGVLAGDLSALGSYDESKFIVTSSTQTLQLQTDITISGSTGLTLDLIKVDSIPGLPIQQILNYDLNGHTLTFDENFTGKIPIACTGTQALKIFSSVPEKGKIVVKGNTADLAIHSSATSKGLTLDNIEVKYENNQTNNGTINIIYGKVFINNTDIIGNRYGISIGNTSSTTLETHISGNSTIVSDRIAIGSNNTYKNNTFKLYIENDAKVEGKLGPAIYWPVNTGRIILSDNAKITGPSGIVMRSGTLEMIGGIIEGTGSYLGSETYPNISGGAVPNGSALLLPQTPGENSSDYGNLSVLISGGKILSNNGYAVEEIIGQLYAKEEDRNTNTQLSESTPTWTNNKTKTKIVVSNGVFISENTSLENQPFSLQENTLKTYPIEMTKFITGGIYSGKVLPVYLSPNIDIVVPAQINNGNFYGYIPDEEKSIQEVKENLGNLGADPNELFEFPVIDNESEINHPYYFLQIDLDGGNFIEDIPENFAPVKDKTDVFNGTIQIESGSTKYNLSAATSENKVAKESATLIGWSLNDIPLSLEDVKTEQDIMTDRLNVLKALWREKYTISIEIEPNSDYGNIIVKVNGTETSIESGTLVVEAGDEVELTAIAESGYSFENWQGVPEDATVSENTVTFAPVQNLTLSAVFKKEPVQNPDTPNPTPGKPGTGSTNSSGGTTSSPQKTGNVTVTPSNSAFGTVSGSGKYTVGSDATLKAQPASGYRFIGWKENGEIVSTKFTYTFKVTGDHNIEAVFEKININNTPTKPSEVEVYRIYNTQSGEHVYTTDWKEVETRTSEPDWNYEDIAWYSPVNGTPVYRLYNPILGNHLYTTDQNEVSTLTTNDSWVSDFNGEPLFYSGGTVPTYRLYNIGLNGDHLLTTDLNEFNVLPNHGWTQETVAFNVLRKGK